MTKEEKAIERCKELIKTEHSCWIGITNQLAIKTVIKKYENQQSELEKKDALINIMQAEFERLENLEDNTDMLKVELEKKDNEIKRLTKQSREFDKQAQRYFEQGIEMSSQLEKKDKIIDEVKQYCERIINYEEYEKKLSRKHKENCSKK